MNYDAQAGALSQIATSGTAQLSPQADAAASATSAIVPVAALNQQHPLYRLNADIWTKLALLYDGSPVIDRNANLFLAQRPKEPAEIYQGRLAKFTYQNILSTALGWYVAKLFKDQLEVDLKISGRAMEPPEDGEIGDKEWTYYDGFLNDCNRAGLSYSSAGQELFRLLLVYRTAYVLIDLPPTTQAASNAAEQRIEPYISIFDPRCAYNWQMDRYGNLLWIVFHSETVETQFLEGEVTVHRWFYYDRQSYRVYEHRSDDEPLDNDGDAKARLIDSGPHAMADFREDPNDPTSPITGRVPVVRRELPEGLWLGGRAFLQLIDHLNTDNCLNWALFLQNLAMPVLKSDREFVQTLSETGFLQIGANDSITWMESSGKSHELSAARLACLREEIFRTMYLQAQGRSSSATASSASGYSKEMDMAPSRDVLNAFGTLMRESLQLILYLIAQIRQDTTVDFDVRGLNYDDDPGLNDLVAAQEVLSLGIQSDTFAKEVQKQMVRTYGNSWNEELKATICEEIDKAPTQSQIQEQQEAQQQQQLEQKLSQASERLITRAGSGREADAEDLAA